MATQAATATDRSEQWEASQDPAQMLQFLDDHDQRKLRLFACACVRTQWIDVDEGYQQIVFDAELHADGLVPYDWLSSVQQKLHTSGSRNVSTIDAYCLGHEGAWDTARLMQALPYGCPPALQAHLLRDVFGNPWRPPEEVLVVTATDKESATVHFPLWLSWQSGLIPRLAQTAYDQRLPDGLLDPLRLAVLADALEEAGCQGEEMLAHLRSPGPHARGCWVLDLLLGKS